MGALLAGSRLARRAAGTAGRVLTPAVRVALDPPLVPRAWRLGPRLDALGRLWQAERAAILTAAVQDSGRASLQVADVVLPLVDLTPVVRSVLARLDLDAVASDAMIDLDLAPLVAAALEQIDLTTLVTTRVDLAAVVTAALDRLDLTEVVVTRVDLQRVVTAALDTLDLTEIAQQRIDIATIAEDVVDDIDLPEIIRASTGGIATEGIRSVRLQSVQADEAVSRLADRLLIRVRRRNVETDVALDAEQPAESKERDGGE